MSTRKSAANEAGVAGVAAGVRITYAPVLLVMALLMAMLAAVQLYRPQPPPAVESRIEIPVTSGPAGRGWVKRVDPFDEAVRHLEPRRVPDGLQPSHDPFAFGWGGDAGCGGLGPLPTDDDSETERLRLRAAVRLWSVLGGASPLANINGRIYRVGDLVPVGDDALRVGAIRPASVVLEQSGPSRPRVTIEVPLGRD